MDQIIEKLLTDPLFLKIGIVIAVLISLSLLKKLVKVVIILVLILLIYGFYVYSTGEEPVKLDDLKERIEELKDIDEKKIKNAGRNVHIRGRWAVDSKKLSKIPAKMCRFGKVGYGSKE